MPCFVVRAGFVHQPIINGSITRIARHDGSLCANVEEWFEGNISCSWITNIFVIYSILFTMRSWGGLFVWKILIMMAPLKTRKQDWWITWCSKIRQRVSLSIIYRVWHWYTSDVTNLSPSNNRICWAGCLYTRMLGEKNAELQFELIEQRYSFSLSIYL